MIKCTVGKKSIKFSNASDKSLKKVTINRKHVTEPTGNISLTPFSPSSIFSYNVLPNERV